MWDTLAEEQSQHFTRICKFWGEDQTKMDGEASEQQTKQERLRTRWTPALDKIFADIVVEQIQLGNRPNNVFDKKTWNQIREEFNKQTNLSFNNNQLRKHLDVLRTRYHNLQSAFTQNDAMQDPCYMGFDLWEDIGVSLSAQTKIEPVKTKECLRTRWTPALDKIFADIVVEQIQLGNRPNNVFDKKTWNQIREEFNKQTNLSFNNNQLRKHLDVLRTRYHNLQSAFTQNDAMQDPCYMGFDLWEDIGVSLSAQTKIEPVKTKECPIYEQLCTIFADSGVDGKYAQSSHYEEFDKSVGINPEGSNPSPKTPSTSKFVQGNGSSPQNAGKSAVDKKRKRSSEVGPVAEQNHWNQELGDAMVKALSDMVQSSKLQTLAKAQTVEKFTITYCIKALDEIEGLEDDLYYAALDLFENPGYREMFISLQTNYLRLTWLQGKCGGLAPFSY